MCRERGLIPFVDIAYQGFGRGLDEDARRRCALMLDACDEVIVAQSCDKNFSVYRDRVGSLFVKTGSREATATAMAPCVPDRARDVVDAARPWRGGGAHHPRGPGASRALAGRARRRCATGSTAVAPADRRGRPAAGLHRPAVRHVLDAAAEQGAGAASCASDHAIYMADSGRFNVVGMGDDADRPIYRRRGRARWTPDAWPTATRAECPPTWTGARSRGWS